MIQQQASQSDLLLDQKINAHRALLCGVYEYSQPLSMCQEHLLELERLVDTYGISTVCRLPIAIRKYKAATLIGEGKVQEIVQAIGDYQADIVVFDDEISASQQRNLEKIFQCPVIDRTEVILEVFSRHAQTKEAKLQIELAQIQYQFPRLKRLWTHLSKQRSGGVYLKGEGEKQVELDRRLLRRRMDILRKELKEIQAHREQQRAQRKKNHIPVFAIVGYTNAGKSTLMKTLTGAQVLIEDKLFCTLDTTTRKYLLPNNQPILIIDTVGFIRKIPHALVAAFRSTLEESTAADILIHLIDANHPMALEQAESALQVLQELGAKDKPIITALNKLDTCTDLDQFNRFRARFSKTVFLSALNRLGIDSLIEKMVQEVAALRQTVFLKIPQSEYQWIHQISQKGQILQKSYEGNDICLEASLPQDLIGQLEKYRHWTILDQTEG